MKPTLIPVALLVLFCLFATGCKTAGYSHAMENEKDSIQVTSIPDAINFSSLAPQDIPSLSQRSRGTRGVFDLGTAISLTTNAVKKMIAKDRAKRIANYTFAITDLYFYDQLSEKSIFDPVGLQFSGFTLVKTFTNSEQKTDTAFIARFELDRSSANEIINNSIFRLTLTEFKLMHSKIKITAAQKENINMDIEITFNTSYVNKMGQMFNNIELGKFYFLLRKAPIDKTKADYATYYEGLKGTRLDGKSFIVPRSFGYYKNKKGEIGESFSQGAYSISVKVTESANDKFITKIISDNSNQIIDMLGRGANKVLSQ
jgi:hypothetical protein